MYEFLGISVVLAALMLLNACASFLLAAGWQLLASLTKSFSARARCDLLFALRIGAPVLAAIIVILFLIPSYVSYEPRATPEVVSKKLAALALLSAASVAFAVCRTVSSWRATAKLRRQWLATAERIDLPGINVPAFRISHRFPIIAIIGTLRPQLFIADDVLGSLNHDELAAAIAHECGHLAARDNLKRTLLRVCRDSLFLVPFGRAVDRVWAETAESAADEFAAKQSPAVALNLASALVRIAKMVPVGARADVPLGAYLVGAEETQGVKSRIRRLIEISSEGSAIHHGNNGPLRLVSFTSIVAFAIIAGVAAGNPKVLMGVHVILERAVNLLS